MLKPHIWYKLKVQRLIHRNSQKVPRSTSSDTKKSHRNREWSCSKKEEMILHEQLSTASAAAAKTKKGNWYKTQQWVPDERKSNYSFIYLFASMANLSNSYTPWSLQSPFSCYPRTTESYVHCGATHGKLAQVIKLFKLDQFCYLVYD